MKKYLLAIPIAALFIGGYIYLNPKPTEPITSSENPDLRCHSLEDIDNFFTTEKRFWALAHRNIPTVTLSEIESGKYDRSYVFVDAWITSVDTWTTSAGDISFVDVGALQQETGTKFENCYLILEFGGKDSPKYGAEVLQNLEEGEKIKYCAFVKNNSCSLESAYAVESLGIDTSIDVKAISQEVSEKAVVERERADEEEKKEEDEMLTESDATTNPLMKTRLQTKKFYSGDKSKILGSYGCISIEKDVLKTVTMDEFIEFAQNVVETATGLNWISIMCEDGTGIVFAGCETYCPMYGKIDEDGAILEGYKNIIWDDTSGTYTIQDIE